MKFKLFLVCMVAVTIMVSCSQEEMTTYTPQGGITRLIAGIENKSRSVMTDEGDFSWTAGDVLSVYDSQTKKFVKFVCEGENVFGIDPEAVEAGITSVYPEHYAVYPAGDYIYSSEGISVNLPDTYGDESSTYQPNTNAAMLAIVDENNPASLQFKHLGGLMRFIVKNVPAGANQFVFTSLDRDITGNFPVSDDTDGNKIISTEDMNDDKNTVTIYFSKTTAVSDMTFFIPLPTGTYTGYKVAIKGENMDLSNESITAENTISRSTMLLMPPFTCKDNELEKTTKQSIEFTQGEDSDGETQEVTVGGGDVDVNTENTGENAVLKLNYNPTEGVSALNITDNNAGGESDKSEVKVELTVPDDAEVATLNIDAPALTVELNVLGNDATATYGEITAKTAVNTLKINKGVTVGTLYLNGGNVVIADGATVENIVNAPNFTEKTYIVGTPTNECNLDNVEYVPTEGEMNLKVAVERWEDYTLFEDVVLSEQLVIDKNFTLHGNGYKIKNEEDLWNEDTKSWSLISVQGGEFKMIYTNLIAKENDCYAIDVRNGATLNILNGKNDHIKGNISAVYVHEGTAIIEGGSYSIQQLSEYNDERYTLNCYDENYANGKAKIKVVGDNCWFSPDFNPIDNLAEGAGTDFVAQGLSVVKNDGYLKVEFGIKNELALRKEILKIEEGGNISLDVPIVLTEQLVINKSMQLHCNGYAISNETPIWNEDTKSWSLISVQGGSFDLVYPNLIAKADDCYAIDVRNGATLNILGGVNDHITGNISAVYVYEGMASIQGGNYGIQQLSEYNDERYTLNCYDENYASGKAKIEVGGGFFSKNFNPMDNLAEGVGTDFVKQGYSVTETDDYPDYLLIEPGILNELALRKEILKIEEGEAIFLDRDIVLTQQLVINKNIWIHTNGNTISNETPIRNEDDKSWSLISVQGGNNVIIEGNLKALNNDCYAIDVRNGATLVVRGSNSEIVGNISAVYVYEGTAKIEEGNYSIQQLSEYGDTRYTLDCYDENYANGKANILVTGGKFKDFNPESNLSEGQNTNFLSSEFKSTYDEETKIWLVEYK